jgi:hypothetical protein
VIEIRNMLFQPLTFQLAGAQEGLHIHSREIREILEEHISEEILSAAARGFIELTGLGSSEESVTGDSPSDTPGNEDQPFDAPALAEAAQPAEDPAAPEAALIEEPLVTTAEVLSETVSDAAEVVEGADALLETADATDTTTTRKRR